MTIEMSPVSMTDKLAEFLLPTEGEIHVGHLALGEMFPMFKALIEARDADETKAFISIRNMLTLRNVPLVKTISRRYEYLLIPYHSPADPAIELADLQQEGYIYLMNAIEKFDDTKGFQFSSYAWWAIKRGMERCLGNSRAVRFPTYLLSRFSRLNQVMVDLWQEQQEKPSVSKLAKALELTEEKVIELIDFARMYESMCSVDAPLVKDETTTLLDMMPAVEASIENELMRTEIKEIVHRLLNSDLLTIRESWVLKLRFGLTFEDALSLNEISKRVGLSRQRICQIEAEALKKLRTLHVWRLVSGYALELGISTPYDIIPQGWSQVQSLLDSIKNIPLGDWNIHGVMTTVTMFFGITRAILILETKDSEMTAARDLTVYLLARKCLLSYEDIARVLSFRSPARCEIAMRRIKEQMKKWGREDLWEENPFESLFKSEAEIAAPMDWF